MNGITCALTGRLGADAELRYTGEGVAFVTFAVAVDDANRADANGAEWVRVAVYGEQAEDLEARLVKGTPVYVEGRVRLDLWETRGGERRATLKMTAWECVPMGQIGRRRPRARRRRQQLAAGAGRGEDA